ncbi:hypothetical protein CFHF_15640 [Caulobacter flavus]|jgi:hypothetical protein|uniref:DUF883 domain-containing protein n=1 Tax=Caulobacter flavus TaxID=1679497 RepID=A0A2N5CRI7_9CAUL|nr:hypothetical protein [Caulobacter flavus]AYV46332.1 hypothetical protein C1707_08720 [Caulobacter flavus]PLR12001.1 hypothetical protein CFHF_15640 [Caulobacter flavus]
MTDATIKTDLAGGASAAQSNVKASAKKTAAKAATAVKKAATTVAETAVEKTQVAREYVHDKTDAAVAWSKPKAEAAHKAAEEHPLALALGTFVAGAVFGFLLARNFDR